jgi:phage-related protein
MGALGGSIGAVAAPIAAIVAAIGVLVAAFIHLWDTNEQFRNDMAGIWNDIVLSVNDAFASITEAINSFGFDFANIVEVLKALWDTYTQFVGVEFKAAFEAVAAIVKTVAGVFEGLGQIITGIMNGEASKAVSGFGTLFESVFGGLATVISTPFKIIFGFIDQLLQINISCIALVHGNSSRTVFKLYLVGVAAKIDRVDRTQLVISCRRILFYIILRHDRDIFDLYIFSLFKRECTIFNRAAFGKSISICRRTTMLSI